MRVENLYFEEALSRLRSSGVGVIGNSHFPDTLVAMRKGGQFVVMNPERSISNILVSNMISIERNWFYDDSFGGKSYIITEKQYNGIIESISAELSRADREKLILAYEAEKLKLTEIEKGG